MRNSQTIEEAKAAKGDAENSKDTSVVKKPRGNPNIRQWSYKPGQSGNPGGRPKTDMAKIIAQAVFEQNPDLIYQAMSSATLKGNAYAFKELASRAYGNLPEHIQVEDVSGSVDHRIAALERELGYADAIDEAGEALKATGAQGATPEAGPRSEAHEDHAHVPGNGATKTGTV